MSHSRPFLFIFVLFKYKFNGKLSSVGFELGSSIEGEHADHLITTQLNVQF